MWKSGRLPSSLDQSLGREFPGVRGEVEGSGILVKRVMKRMYMGVDEEGGWGV